MIRRGRNGRRRHLHLVMKHDVVQGIEWCFHLNRFSASERVYLLLFVKILIPGVREKKGAGMYSRRGTTDIMSHDDGKFCIVLLLFQVIVIVDALAINRETRFFPSFPMTAYPLLLPSLSLASFAVHHYHPLPSRHHPTQHPPKCTESHYSKRWSDTGNLFYIQTHQPSTTLGFSERGRGRETTH